MMKGFSKMSAQLGFFLAMAAMLLLTPLLAGGEAPAPDDEVADAEVHFLKNMIDHHQMAIEMATVCQGKDIRLDLKSTCEAIETSQEEEIETMTGWLEEWYGMEYRPPPPPKGGQLDLLNQIDGNSYEIEFMKSMIIHHWEAVLKAERITDQADHEPLRDLAQEMVTAQTKEIGTMQGWLSEWHGVPAYGPNLSAGGE